ncbi:MAG TPA: PilW family protein [Rhodocyclaceae bacterium]
MNIRPPLQRGFSLIELLIGMAIGLVGLFAVSQIMLSFNKQRGSINQTLATQSNGVMALYLLERDISQAGYGMMNLQCPWINYSYDGTGYYNTPYQSSTLPGAGNVALTALPVRIHNNDGGLGNDIIEVQYGKTASGVPGATITTAQTAYADAYTVASTTGIADGDMFVTYSGSVCTLGQVSAAPTATTIPHVAGVSAYNVTTGAGGTGWNTVTSADLGLSPKPFVADMGNFVSRRFAVRSGALTLAELPSLNPAVTTPPNLVDDIIFLKAQYGLASSASSSAVATWASADDLTTTPYDGTKAARVIAIRVGVVARSPLLEKEDVTTSTTLTVLPAVSGTSTTTPGNAGECATDATSKAVLCKVPDVTGGGAGSKYRYRAYSTIIPLKNAIWTR